MLFGGGEPGTPDGLGGSAEFPTEVFGVCSELVAGGYDPLELHAGGVRTLLTAFPGHYRLVEAGLGVVVADPGCLLGLAHPPASLFLRHTLTRSRPGLFGYPRMVPVAGFFALLGRATGRLRRPSGGGLTLLRPHRATPRPHRRLTRGFAAKVWPH